MCKAEAGVTHSNPGALRHNPAEAEKTGENIFGPPAYVRRTFCAIASQFNGLPEQLINLRAQEDKLHKLE